jgi:hypothetical protein
MHRGQNGNNAPYCLVLIAGGSETNLTAGATDAAEIFTFATKGFTPAGMMSHARIFPSGSGFH